MGWTTEESEIESRKGHEFSILHIIQTGSGAHPASCPMDTGAFSAGSKAARA
jgi:hypothetical protein